MWGVSLMFVKLSFLLFFSKIFTVGGSQPVFKFAIAFVLLWGVGNVLSALLVCQPIAFNWDPTIPGGVCGNRPASYISVGILHIITDVMVLVIPIPYIWRLQVKISRKISVFIVFCMGFRCGPLAPLGVAMAYEVYSCCIISLVRVIELFQVTYDDITYSLVPGSYLTLLEPAFAIFIFASLPAMAPLADRISSLRACKSTSRGRDVNSLHTDDEFEIQPSKV